MQPWAFRPSRTRVRNAQVSRKRLHTGCFSPTQSVNNPILPKRGLLRSLQKQSRKKDIGQMHCLSVMMMNPHHPMTEALIQILTVTGLNLLHMGPHQKHLNQRGKCVKGTKRIITTKLHAIFRMNNYHQNDEDGQILKLLGTLFCKRHNQHQPLSEPLDYDTTSRLSSSLLNSASSPA